MNKEHIVPQLLLRSWPFFRGTTLIIHKLFPNLVFKEEIAEVETTDGFKMKVMPNELIGRHIYLTGAFCRSTVVEALCSLAKPGDTLLDVGANIGYVSACFLRNVQRSDVIAIEPQPGIVDLLRSNLSQFSGRYRIVPVALSNRDGICHFEINSGNRGASKIVSSDGPNTQPVEMWSAGKMLAAISPPKIDLIKLDVEGHEEQVLAALKPAIEQFRPRAILFEEHANKAAPNRPIGALMEKLGYKVFGLHKRFTKMQLTPILGEADCVHSDYMALKTP